MPEASRRENLLFPFNHMSATSVFPLTLLDQVGVDHSSITLVYILDPAALVGRDWPAELDQAAHRVVEKWPSLAGTVVWSKELKGWALRVPSSITPEHKTHKFTQSVFASSINLPNLSHSRILDRPPVRFFCDPSTKASTSDFARSGDPLLSFHTSVFLDAVCLGITFPHGVFDATGMGQIVRALDAELAGRPWFAPSPPLGNALLAALGELESERKGQEEDELRIKHAELFRDYVAETISAWFWLFATLAFEYFAKRAKTRQIFLTNEVVEDLVASTKAEVTRMTGGEEWVSTGDVLVAWILKSAYPHPTSTSLLSTTSVLSLRSLLPSLPPYPHNATVTFTSLPPRPLSTLPQTSLARLALLHRRSLTLARTPSFLLSYLAHLESGETLVRRTPGVRSWIFTNQVVAGLPELSALGRLKGFWLYERPLLLDHVVAINRVEEGWLLMAVLRREEWEAVEEAVRGLARG